MTVTIWETNDEGARLLCTGSREMVLRNTDVVEEQGHPGDVEQHLINLHPSVHYQTVYGIGGAFTEAAALALSALPKEKQQEVMTAYFDPDRGIGYNFGRISIGSCDFSAEDYTYVAEGDRTIEWVDLSHDEQAVFGMVREAAKHCPLSLLASPWSPPAYMKTNGKRIGGHLREDCYALWANHFRKYVDACHQAGIPVDFVTLQNEPRHHQTWESCLYTPEEEARLLGFVGQALEGTGVKILCYDHCRERVLERAQALFSTPNGRYCDGIAHHWYSGDHFGELRAMAQCYPDKISLMSEGCRGILTPGGTPEDEWTVAQSYIHDMIGCFQNGLHSFCDWNLVLNEHSGPFHNRENRGCYADAAIYCNACEQTVVYRLAYYYIGHISKFIQRGSRVIATSCYTEKLDVCGFENADGSVVCVIANRHDEPQPVVLRLGDWMDSVMVKPKAVLTFVINRSTR